MGDGGAARKAVDRRRRLRAGLTSPICALVLVAVAAGTGAAAIPLGSAAHQSGSAGFGLAPAVIACIGLGCLLALRRPDNPIGWCLLGVAVFGAFNDFASAYSVLDYRMHHGTLPLGWLAVLLQPSWAPTIMLFGLIVLIFPDGHLPSRPVRWATGAVLAAGALWLGGAFAMAASGLASGHVRVDAAGNILTSDHPVGVWAWWGIDQDVFFVLLLVSWAVWLAGQVPRYRHAGMERRVQLRWLLSGATTSIVAGVLFFVTSSSSSTAAEVLGWVGAVGICAMPVSIAVGVTKFRLYDLDRLLSRSLAYLLVTGLVVGLYAGLVTLATKAIGVVSPVAVAAATLAAAALFSPLRRRVQRGVDRRFNRARYDAEVMVSEFAAHLRDAVDPARVRDELLGVVHDAFEPSRVALWVRPRRGSQAP